MSGYDVDVLIERNWVVLWICRMGLRWTSCLAAWIEAFGEIEVFRCTISCSGVQSHSSLCLPSDHQNLALHFFGIIYCALKA